MEKIVVDTRKKYLAAFSNNQIVTIFCTEYCLPLWPYAHLIYFPLISMKYRGRHSRFQNNSFISCTMSHIHLLNITEHSVPDMDSVRQRRREEAAATRERISEIKKKMQV